MTSARYSSKNSARISSCLLVALGLSLASAEPLGTSLGLPVLEELPAPLQVQRAEVGRRLFFDRRLSPNETMSCAICHVPEQGFTSNEIATSVGMFGKSLRRNAPTLLNVRFQTSFFLDGRERSLESQVWGPLLAKDEMSNGTREAVVRRVSALPGYQAAFARAFPDGGLTADSIASALAAYQQTLIAGNSRFDRWYFGGEANALTMQEQQGFELFRGKAGCSSCHRVEPGYALFTDHAFHVTGAGARASPAKIRVQLAPGIEALVASEDIKDVTDPPVEDFGRWEATFKESDRYAFRTPSLRNVSLTAPYMHDGSLSTLEQVVDFYVGAGGREGVDRLLKPLSLNAAEKRALVVFLGSLEGANVDALIAAARRGFVADHIE